MGFRGHGTANPFRVYRRGPGPRVQMRPLTACTDEAPTASGREWMLGIPKRNGRNGCLKQTCRANLLSAVRHILRTWAAERLAAPLPTHCCNLDNCSLVCSSHIAQLRAQSISCNPNLGHNHCIVRNKSWRRQLRDKTLCFSA